MLKPVGIHVAMITDEMEYRAEEAGLKLELINGLTVWEASPVIHHQKKIDSIRASIKQYHQDGGGCACIHYADIYILFPDGSIKRPDISIFCKEPEQQDTMCETVPEAVIEILSKGYEKKDTEVGLPFYLEQGINDIVLFNPAANLVTHYHEGKAHEYASPIELTFACGCRVAI